MNYVGFFIFKYKNISINLFMKLNISEITEYLNSLNRYSKIIVAIITDAGLCIFCTWIRHTKLMYALL